MNSNVKISIIIPVYNVAEYLPRCIESCIQQTLYDIEIICVNDGSTDNSLELLHSYEKIDPRLVVIDQENRGLSAARNAGLRVADGTWIMFLDSDDFYSSDACERVWLESLEAPTEILTFGTNIFPAYPAAESWYEWTLNTATNRYWGFNEKILFDNPHAKPFVWRQAFSSSFLRKHGLEFAENIRYGEDIIFQMEAFPQAKYIAFISDKLYNYRWCREDSLMNTQVKDPDSRIEKHLSVVEEIFAYWAKKNWFEKYGRKYLEWVIEYLVPDLRSRDVTNTHEYAQRLNTLLDLYGLKKYKRGLRLETRELLYLVSKM